MKKKLNLSMIALLSLAFVACQRNSASAKRPDVTPTKLPVPTVTLAPEPTEELTTTPEPTEELTPSVAPTEELTSTPEPTEEPTSTPEPTEEPTPTPEPTEEPTPTLEPTEEPTLTPKPTNSPTPTVKPSPTATPKPTVKPTPKPTPTSKPTPTPKLTVDEEREQATALFEHYVSLGYPEHWLLTEEEFNSDSYWAETYKTYLNLMKDEEPRVMEWLDEQAKITPTPTPVPVKILTNGPIPVEDLEFTEDYYGESSIWGNLGDVRAFLDRTNKRRVAEGKNEIEGVSYWAQRYARMRLDELVAACDDNVAHDRPGGQSGYGCEAINYYPGTSESAYFWGSPIHWSIVSSWFDEGDAWGIASGSFICPDGKYRSFTIVCVEYEDTLRPLKDNAPQVIQAEGGFMKRVDKEYYIKAFIEAGGKLDYNADGSIAGYGIGDLYKLWSK